MLQKARDFAPTIVVDSCEQSRLVLSQPELDVIWNRFVGIVLRLIAMHLAFAFPRVKSRVESSDLDAYELDADPYPGKAPLLREHVRPS